MSQMRLRDADDWQLADSNQDIRGADLIDVSGAQVGRIKEIVVMAGL